MIMIKYQKVTVLIKKSKKSSVLFILPRSNIASYLIKTIKSKKYAMKRYKDSFCTDMSYVSLVFSAC